MKDLMGVLLSNQVSTEYRVKLAFEPSKKQIQDLKFIFDKYDCKSVSSLDRTIFQSKPLDFYSLDCGEIWIIDFDLLKGIQPDLVRSEISKELNVPESFIVVGLKEVPHTTYEVEDDIDFDEEEYVPKTLDTNYSDMHDVPDDVYGDKLLDKTISSANNDYNNERTPYSEYMIAGYEQLYQIAKPDVQPEKPNKV